MSKNGKRNKLSLNDYLHILTAAAIEYETNGGTVEFAEDGEGTTIFLPFVRFNDMHQELYLPDPQASPKQS